MTSAIPATSASFDQGMMRAQQSNGLLPSLSAEKLKNIDKTAEDFEAVFISEMVSHMFNGVGEDSMFSGGYSEEVFKSMTINEYGKQIAARGGIGLADNIKEEMIKMQEQQVTN